MTWRMNGAGDDPVEFYSEVEPKVRKIAEEYREGRPGISGGEAVRVYKETIRERLKDLIGQRRMNRDADAILERHLPEDCDTWVTGVRLMAEKLPPAGDKRNRLYHYGAADTMLAAMDEALGL